MFADMELIGIPRRIVVGEKSLDDAKVDYRGRLETKNRFGKKSQPDRLSGLSHPQAP